MRLAVLCHEKFPGRAKTAIGVMRYGENEVVAVLDRKNAGRRVSEFLPDVPDAPILSGMEETLDAGIEVDALLIGISPIGGGFEASWRPDVRSALEAGCDVLSGLHYFLSEDDEFRALAESSGSELRDLRKPPEDLTVGRGIAGDVDATIVLTVGTDCSVGKMTATCELLEAAREAGWDAGFVPTGQTGIAIEGEGVAIEGQGIAIDRVVSDFAAGAVERMIEKRGGREYLFVEGQGSIVHPAYSGVTCSILHGAMPDALVLCHEAGREKIHGYEQFSLPSLSTYVDLYERLAAPVRDAPIVAGALNTRSIENGREARRAIDSFAEEIGVPSTDPVRFGAAELLEAIR